MPRPITDFGVLTLDCYGTLIDWETGIWDALQPLIAANGRLDVTRSLALQAFGRLEAAQEAATPGMAYPEVLRRVHRDLATGFAMESDDPIDEAFGASIALWPAFADTADALRSLQRRYRLVVLSNVDRDGFAASNRKLGVVFDSVFTAEEIGSYKPDPANFRHLL
ncbi:MAG: haloacid dehalogenase, partial [Actinobacteria bacterium]